MELSLTQAGRFRLYGRSKIQKQKMSEQRRRVKRRGKKKKKAAALVVLLAILACVIALIILYLTHVIEFKSLDTAVNNRTAVAYINYDDSDMLINSDGKVLEQVAEEPVDIPELTGLVFSKIEAGELLECDSKEAFEYVMKIVLGLRGYDIRVEEINLNENYEASAYVNNIVILFGTDDKTETKITDLNDFYDQVKDLRGTLHMEEVNEKLGYTFKQESGNKPVIKEAETGETTVPSEEGQEGAEEGAGEEQAWEEPAQEEYYEEPVAEEPAQEEYYEEQVWEEPAQEEYYEEPVAEEPVQEEYYEEQW